MAQQAMVKADWGAAVKFTVALQWVVVVLVSGFTLAGFGSRAGASALAGAVAVALPNTLFALALLLRWRLTKQLPMTWLFGGELVKIVLTFALLVLAVRVWLTPPVWLAIIAAMILTIKSQWVALLLTRRM